MKERQKISLGHPAQAGDFLLQRRLHLLLKYTSDLNENSLVLDYGCGNGAQTSLIARKFPNITAIDVSEEQIGIASENLREFQSVNVTRYDGVRMPVDDNTFDLVYSFEVLEHTGDDRKSVEDICRVLKPDGLFVFTVPNKWWIFETHGANLPLLKWNRVPFFSWLPACIHSCYARARIYTKSSIVKLLKDSGFQILKLSYVTAPLDALKHDGLRNFMRNTIFKRDETSIPFYATAIMCVAVKHDR